jgi:PhoH-like ATPase
MAKQKNIYVIDTCVLLHDPECIYKFEEHDIYIPLACIDDLDEIKTRRDNSAWAAREVFRNLDKYDIQQVTKGIVVNDKGGKMFIYNHESLPARGEKPSIMRVNSDNAIIDTAHLLISSFPKRKVVIVTKDTGLRVRANTWGCVAENYKNDLLDDDIYKGYRIVEVSDLSDWEYLNKRNNLNKNILKCKDQLEDINPNEFITFKFGEQSVFAWNKYNGLEFLEEKKKKDSFMGISAKNMEQRFALEALNDDNIPLVCLSGPAGSGKSLVTIAAALEKINLGIYDRLIVMKPLIAVGGKDIGFLPGSKLEKVSAWLGPIKDNLIQLTNSNGYSEKNKNKFEGLCFENMVEDGIIEAEAMTFIQGRSIPNSFIMLDECLTGDSLIYLSDGSVKTIESIQDGEKVISFNTETQTWSENFIKSKFVRKTEELITINTSRNILKCTPTHKMWVYENGEKLVKKSAENITLADIIPINNSFKHIIKNDLSEETVEELLQNFNYESVPNDIWNAPLNSVRKFIQLCFRKYPYGRLCLTGTFEMFYLTFNFASQIQSLLLKFSIDSQVIQDKSTSYRIIIENYDENIELDPDYKESDTKSACKINNIFRTGETTDVYDFEVENDHTFVVNGILSSNCENVSPKEARMVVERCGKGSKVVLLGDLSQIENPYLDKHSCGLAHAINGGKTHEVAASVNMTKVERSVLAAAASKIFKPR